MINYEPFWTTMEKRGLTAYQLIYYWGISSNTLRRMRHNEAISTPTLNELCLILDCSVEDILKFEASKEAQEELALRKQEIVDHQLSTFLHYRLQPLPGSPSLWGYYIIDSIEIIIPKYENKLWTFF